MLRHRHRLASVLAVVCSLVVPASASTPLPAPAVDAAPAVAKAGTQTAVFAGGCFWGVEAVFRHVNGVSRAVSGYSGGKAKNPTYGMVSSGLTGHAEAVEVTFDPAKISYGQLLRVFFAVAHDPTELNRQGPDVGTQYRSAIFYASDEQKRIAEAYIAQLGAAKAFPSPIVTQVAALTTFYPAEAYHQNYLALHRNEPYIVYNDLPKLEALKVQFPSLYVAAK